MWVVGTLAAIAYPIYRLTGTIPYKQFEQLCNREIAITATPRFGEHLVVYRYGSRSGNVVNVSQSRFTAVKTENGVSTNTGTMYGICRVRNGRAELSETQFE